MTSRTDYRTTEDLQAVVASTLERYPHFAEISACCPGCADSIASEGWQDHLALRWWQRYAEAIWLLEGRHAGVEA